VTKKDYAAIAAAINNGTIVFPDAANQANADRHEAFMAGANDQVKQLARHIAGVMQADNPRFDRERFFKACGIE